MGQLESLSIKIFADGADLESMLKLHEDPMVQGFTTNPSLMRKSGVEDYERFAKTLLSATDKPISFEIFADEFSEMEAQAREIASWDSSVYVKIPVTNTKGEFTGPLISKLSQDGIALNVTALFTVEQVKKVAESLSKHTPSIVSVFAGRIADAGVDPEPVMLKSADILQSNPNSELLWASAREIFNIFQAQRTGCQIITITYDMLSRLHLIGKSLDTYSLETVKGFYQDAKSSNYRIETTKEFC